MGIRLESLLLVSIVAIVAFSLTLKLGEDIPSYTPSGKLLEFNTTTFIEVDQSRLLSRTFSRYGVKHAELFTLEHIRYHTDTIEQLSARHGKLKGSRFYLDGNVTLHQKQGFDYHTEHAVYEKKQAILTLTSPFVAQMNENLIRGARLRYDTRSKAVLAHEVNATLYPVDHNSTP